MSKNLGPAERVPEKKPSVKKVAGKAKRVKGAKKPTGNLGGKPIAPAHAPNVQDREGKKVKPPSAKKN